jgi:hypothetical protein
MAGPATAIPRTTTVPVPNVVLRRWREAHGLSRSQMARALINTPTAWRQSQFLRCGPELVAGWEEGRVRWPSPKYEVALRDLTGKDPAELGFIASRRPRRAGRGVPLPSSPPAAGTAAAVADLAGLAAELSQRGYRTHLTVSPPRLTVDSPGLPRPVLATEVRAGSDRLPGPGAA